MRYGATRFRGTDGKSRYPVTQALALCLATLVSLAWVQPVAAESGYPAIEYVLDGIEVRGNKKTDTAFVRDLAGVEVGQTVDLAQLEPVKLRLLGTGYFEDVDLRLERGGERGHVVLVVEVRERNTIILSDIFLGSSPRHPFWGGADVVEGNFLGRGLSLGAAGVVGNGQWGAEARLADPYAFNLPLRIAGTARFRDGAEPIFLRGTPQETLAGADEVPLLHYRRAGGELGGGIYPLSLLGVFLDLGYEHVEARSDLPDLSGSSLRSGSSHHPYVRLSLDHDTRDNPLAATRGYRLNLQIGGSHAAMGGDYDYFKAVLRTAYHKALRFGAPGHVVRFELFGGYIHGDAPFFERFFVGDVSALVPSRDLELNFASRPSADLFRTGAGHLAYESVLAGGTVEYGVPIFQGRSPLYRVEFFLGAGLFGMTTPGDLPGTRDASLGVRSPTDGPGARVFPVDMTFDVGFRAETPVGVFGLSFANGLALVPF
jgi:outer membrane protein insertion porin family